METTAMQCGLLGEKLESRAKLLGGIMLILIGVKILVEHLSGLA